MSLKVIAFDVFGTVFDLSSAAREEVKDYVRHVHLPEWKPLKLPKSWETMPAHHDSAEGIALLRKQFIVVTCSNGPLGLLAKLSKHNNVQWDAIIPLELNKVYKPNPRAYRTVCEVLDVEPHEVLMVTANRTFGDLESSKRIGMQSVLIRSNGGPRTIIDLANLLGVKKDE